MRILSVAFICLLCTYSSLAQELKLKKNRSGEYLEEYTVLKEDKKIKHGEYIKFRLDILGNKSVVKIGQYDQGEKTGNWYAFNKAGFLKSEGQYVNDLKSGLWNYYYEPINNKPTFSSQLNTNKGIIINENGSIDIIKDNLPFAARGVYQSGKKMGSWNYYTKTSSSINSITTATNF